MCWVNYISYWGLIKNIMKSFIYGLILVDRHIRVQFKIYCVVYYFGLASEGNFYIHLQVH